MERPTRSATIATALVLATGAAVAVVASRPGSPFTPPLYPGAEAPGFLRGAADVVGLDSLSRDLVAVVGAAALFAAAGAFLYALGVAWRGELSLRRVILVALVLHALAVAIPVFLSRDVYSYAIYGRMVSRYGANPYVDIPAAFATDATYSLVSVDWLDSPSVYGPAFSAIAAGVTAVVDSPAATVLSFKVLAAAASLGTMLLSVAGARRLLPGRTAFAAALIGWNPVVVFHGVAGAHNDALLGAAIAAAVVAIAVRRDLLATAVLAVGTLVKVSGAVPLLVALAVAVIRRRRGERLRTFALHVVVGLAVALPFVVPFMQTEDPTLGAMELTSRQGWLAPSRFVLVAFRGAGRAIGGEVVGDVASLLVRLALPHHFLWTLWSLLRHLARDPGRLDPEVTVGAMGWASLISLLVSPVLLPWYVAWVIPLAWLLPRPARGGAVLVSVALTITELVAEPSRSPEVWEAMVFGLHWVATPLVLFVLVRLVLDLRARIAATPARGFLDPLLVEAVPTAVPAARPPERSLVATASHGDGQDVSTGGDDPDRDEGGAASR